MMKNYLFHFSVSASNLVMYSDNGCFVAVAGDTLLQGIILKKRYIIHINHLHYFFLVICLKFGIHNYMIHQFKLHQEVLDSFQVYFQHLLYSQIKWNHYV